MHETPSPGTAAETERLIEELIAALRLGHHTRLAAERARAEEPPR